MRSSGMAAAIEELEPPADARSLAELLALRDRFEAKLALGIAAFDADGGWQGDASSSVVAWLRRQGLSAGDAARLAAAGKRAAAVPALSAAWLEGRLSGGQVQAIVGNVTDKTADLFADHAPELIPSLEPLTVTQTENAMRAWAARAAATLDDPDPGEPERSLHASRTFGGRLEVRGSFDSTAAADIEAALRTAATDDDPGTPRTAAQRRADALTDLCRFFLTHQQTATEVGRHRPHVNVVIDLDDLLGDATGGHILDGQLLDPDAIRTPLCDSNVHRVLTDGKGTILDDGRSSRTAPPPLFTALVIRDGHCRLVPGCDRGPAWLDAHHVIPWEDHGETSLANMVLGCRRHHHLLHRQHWEQQLAADGSLTITTPDGRTWTTHPAGTLSTQLALAG